MRNKTIVELEVKRKLCQKEANNYSDAVTALRKVCDHEWQSTGHGHNYESFICLECGEEEDR